MSGPAGGSEDGRRSVATLVHVASNLPGSNILTVSALVGIDTGRLLDLSNRVADASQAEVGALRAYVEESVRPIRRRARR